MNFSREIPSSEYDTTIKQLDQCVEQVHHHIPIFLYNLCWNPCIYSLQSLHDEW